MTENEGKSHEKLRNFGKIDHENVWELTPFSHQSFYIFFYYKKWKKSTMIAQNDPFFARKGVFQR